MQQLNFILKNTFEMNDYGATSMYELDVTIKKAGEKMHGSRF
jgi:hypothetical protein